MNCMGPQAALQQAGRADRLLLLQRFMADLKDEALIESQPAMSGRTMSMTLAPVKP